MIELIVDKEPKSPISEAYRTVRTNIEFSSLDKEMKLILITSSGPQEGKSTTSSNLALAMAQSGKKTLLIDCDLRKPTIHKKYKISNRIGLSNLLADGLKLSDAVFCFGKGIDILTSGTIPPNPSEMLSSNKMKIFLQEASKVYDRIILDSPPLNAVTDAQILATIADGVVLVVGSGVTDIEMAKRAKELLDKVKANILGAVLNKAESMGSKYGSNKYYYYYSEGGEKKRRKRDK